MKKEQEKKTKEKAKDKEEEETMTKKNQEIILILSYVHSSKNVCKRISIKKILKMLERINFKLFAFAIAKSQ